MSAIIAGEGLGLFNSSLNQGIATHNGQTALGQARENIFVNAATGNLVVQGQDELIKGLGLGFGLTRTYNSLGNFDGDNNGQWRLGFLSDISLEGSANQAGSRIFRTTADGYEQEFSYDATAGHYVSNKGADSHDIIVWQGNTAIFKLDGREQQTETYNTLTKHLIARTDANGNTTTINYVANKPSSINVSTKTGVQTTNLKYNADGLLEKIETLDPVTNINAVKVYYGYDTQNRLNSIKIDNTPDDRSKADDDVYEISYTYHGTSNRLETIRQSDGSYLKVGYTLNANGDYRVSKTTNGYGVNTYYEYVNDLHTKVTHLNYFTNHNEIVDYRFDTAKNLTSITRQLDGESVATQFSYTEKGQLETVTDGLKNITRYAYDANGNQISVTDAEMRVVTRTYSSTNLLLTETTDGSTQRFVYAGSNLRFSVAADGAVTEYQYDALGLRTSMRQYTVSKFNVDSLAATDSIELSVLEGWVTDLTNREQQLTEYQYDFRGQLASVSQYSTVDQLGKGAGNVSTHKFVYDYSGNLLQEISARSVEAGEPETYRKTYQYDGLGRRVQATDELGVITSYLFDDANQRIITKYANGLWQTEVYDQTGRTISVQKGTADNLSAFGSVTYYRDARGQIVTEQHEAGVKYNLHDKNGRLAASADEQGVVTRYFYNKANQLIAKTVYANKVDTSDWQFVADAREGMIDVVALLAALDDIIIPSAEYDRHTEYVYNKTGQLRFVRNAEGYVTESRYNAKGLLSASITYDDAITDFEAFIVANNDNKAQRKSSIIYNKNGQVEFETDAEGYLTQYYYDAAGNNVAIRRYATKATPQTAVVSAEDKVSFTFYDAAGRVKASISPEGQVTSMHYDADGNLKEQHVYATAVRNHQLGQSLILPTGDKRSTYYQYDKRGALSLETTSSGSATQYHYDDMGQLIKRQIGSVATLGQPQTTERYQYDLMGRLTSTLDGNQNAQLADASSSEIEAAFNTTGAMRKTYDLRGNLIAAIDASGFKNVFYYDEKQQLRYKIDAEGQISAYSYTSFGQLEKTQHFINQLTISERTPLEGGDYQLVAELIESKRDDKNDITTQSTYDRRGLTASSTDADDYLSEFEYNAFTQLIKQTTRNILSEGDKETLRVDEFSYDKRGLLLQQVQDIDGANLLTSSTYDAFGRLETSINAAQQLTSYSYDTQFGQNPDQVGKVIVTSTTINGTTRQTISRYDLFGREYQQVDAHGNTTSYTYNEADNSVTVTGADNVKQITRRDTQGRISEVQVKSADNAILQTSQYIYDANGNITERWLNGVLQETKTYDNNNQVLTSTDANGNKVRTSYDGVGRVRTSISYPDGVDVVTSWHYKNHGTVVEQKQKISDEETRLTTTYFDGKGRVKEVVKSGLDAIDGLKTQYRYDRTGNKLQVIEGAGSSQPIITAYQYNVLGQLVSSAKGDDAPTQYIYNDKGQLVETRTLIDQVTTVTGIIDRYAQQVYRYNDAGELTVKLTISTVSPTLTASVESYEYDKLGRQISTHRYSEFLTLPQTQTELTSDLTALDSNISSFISSADKVSDYTVYDSENRKTAYIDATGATTLYHYDGLGRVTEQVRKGRYADISAANISALKAGTFTASAISYKTGGVADARIANVYDNQGRLSHSLTDIDGRQAAVKQNHYDAAGNLIKTTVYAKTVAYQSDYSTGSLTNALISKGATTDADNRVNWFFYDKADRLRFSVDSRGAVTETRYDNSNKVTQVIQFAELLDSSALATKFNTDTLVYKDLRNHYSKDVFDSNYRVTKNSYDNAGRLIAVKDAAGYTEEYKYNANGLLFSRIDKNNQEWRFNYDNSGRVTAEFSPKLTGIQTLVNGSYETITGFAVKQYQYDGAGNVVSIKEGVHKGSAIPITPVFYGQVRETSFSYDAAGRQTKVTQPQAENAPNTITITDYDALGRAVRNSVLTNHPNVMNVYLSQQHIVYDAAGRKLFDLDATEFSFSGTFKAHVTQYGYDALGNQTTVKRYANSIDLGWLTTNTGWMHGKPLTASDILASKNINGTTTYALVADPANDRTITTSFYANGLKKSVTENSRTYQYLDANGSVKTATGQPKTEFSYNTFGEVWKTAVLSHRDTVEHWLTSYDFYNNTGLKVASVDAAGYLTSWQHNSFGQVETQIEYARALGNTSFSVYSVPTAPVAGDNTTGLDRKKTFAYDKMGRLQSETQHNVALWQRSDGQNTLAAVSSIQIVNAYDALGQLESTSQNGNITAEIDYDVLGNVISSKSASFAALKSTSAGTINATNGLNDASVYNTVQKITEYQYDIFGNAVTVTQKGTTTTDDIVTQYEYNTRGQAIKTIDPLGFATISEYDHQGNVVKTSKQFTEPTDTYSYSIYHYVREYDAEHNKTDYRRAAMPGWLSFDVRTGTFSGKAPETGSLTLTVEANISGVPRVKDIMLSFKAGDNVNSSVTGWAIVSIESGNKTIVQNFIYNAQSQLTEQNIKLIDDNSANTESTQLFAYNSFGEVVRKNNTFYRYNQSGNVLMTNQDDNILKTNQLDLAGRVVATSHAANGTTRYALDSLGRINTVYNPTFVQDGETLQGKIQQSFDRWGNVVRYTDANGYLYTYQYNVQNKVVLEQRPEVIDVDEQGAVSLVTPTTRYRYDIQGNLLETTDHYGRKAGQEFNALGQLTQTINALGGKEYFAFDQFGRQVASQNLAGLISTTNYDKAGQVKEVGDIRINADTNAHYNHTLTTYNYNEVGHRILQQDALGSVYHYKHDARGNVIYVQTPNAAIKEYAYDTNGYKTLERYRNIYTSNTPDLNQNTWANSSFGNLLSHNDLGGKNYQYEYFGYNSLSETGQVITNVKSTRLKTQTNGHGQNLSYTYYENGWLKSITDNAKGAESEYRYNAAGQKVWERQKARNAFGEVINQVTTTQYDSNGRIQQVVTRNSDTAEIVSKVLYTYDALGNRRSIKVWNGYDGYISDAGNSAPIAPEDKNISIAVNNFLPEQRVTFVDPDNDTLSFAFKLNGELLTVEQIAEQLPWLTINIQPESQEVLISGTAAVPAELKGQTLHLEIIASDGQAVSAPASVFINVEEAVSWESIPGQYLIQDGEAIFIGDYLKGNSGASYRIGTAIAQSSSGPVDVQGAFDADTLTKGYLAISPNYQGDVEHISLTLIATVNGVDVTSESFTVTLDYSPITNGDRSETIRPGEQLQAKLDFTDKNITTTASWTDNPIAEPSLQYTYELDGVVVTPDSNGMLNDWLTVTAGEDGVTVTSQGSVPQNTLRNEPYKLKVIASDGKNAAISSVLTVTVTEELPPVEPITLIQSDGVNMHLHMKTSPGNALEITSAVATEQYLDPTSGSILSRDIDVKDALEVTENGLLRIRDDYNGDVEQLTLTLSTTAEPKLSRTFIVTVDYSPSAAADKTIEINTREDFIDQLSFTDKNNTTDSSWLYNPIDTQQLSYTYWLDGELVTPDAEGKINAWLKVSSSNDGVEVSNAGFISDDIAREIPYKLQVVASDGKNAAVTGTLFINVEKSNYAPVIDYFADPRIQVGQTVPAASNAFNLGQHVYDPDGTPVRFSLLHKQHYETWQLFDATHDDLQSWIAANPARDVKTLTGLSIDPDTGQISGTATTTVAAYDLVLVAHEATGNVFSARSFKLHLTPQTTQINVEAGKTAILPLNEALLGFSDILKVTFSPALPFANTGSTSGYINRLVFSPSAEHIGEHSLVARVFRNPFTNEPQGLSAPGGLEDWVDIPLTITVTEATNTAPVIKTGAPTSATRTEGYRVTLDKAYFQSMFTDSTPNGALDIEFDAFPNYLTKTDGGLTGVIPFGVSNGTIKVRAVDTKGAASAQHTLTLVTQAITLPQGNIVLSNSAGFKANLEAAKPAETTDIKVSSTHFEEITENGNHLLRMKAGSVAAGIVSGSATINYHLASGLIASKTITVTYDYKPEFPGETITLNNLRQGDSATINLPIASDKNPDDVLRYSFVGGTLPAGMDFDLKALKLHGTPTASGSGTFSYKVEDNDKDHDIMTVNWTVAPPNTAPVIDYFADPRIQVGQTVPAASNAFNLGQHVYDPDGTPVSFSLLHKQHYETWQLFDATHDDLQSWIAANPARDVKTLTGLSIDPDTGQISGTATTTVAAYDLVLVAHEATGNVFSARNFKLHLTPQTTQINVEAGKTAILPLKEALLGFGDILKVTFSPALPFANTGSTSGYINRLEFSPSAEHIGEHSLVARVFRNPFTNEPQGLSTPGSLEDWVDIPLTITVTEATNTAPVIKTGAPTSATRTEGYRVTLDKAYFQSMFTDSTPNGALNIEFDTFPSYLTKTDGGLTGVIPFGVSNGTIKVRAVDTKGAASAQHTLTLVTKAITLPQGNIVLSNSAGFKANLEAAKPAETTDIKVSSTHFEVITENGNHLLRMKAGSVAAGVVSGSATINYHLASGLIASKTITVTYDYKPEFPGETTTLNNLKQGAAITVSLPVASDKNPDDVLRYSFVSGTVPVGMSFSATGPKLSGTPTATGSGTFTYRVSDNNGDTDTMTVSWTVSPSAPTNKLPTGTIPPTTATEGKAFSYNIAEYITDPDGDTLNFTADYYLREYDPELKQWFEYPVASPQGLNLSRSGVLSGTPGYTTNGLYVVKVTISDGSGSITRNFNLTINNANGKPTATTIPTQIYNEGQNVDFSVASYFSDPDYDKLTFTPSNLPYNISMDKNGRVTGWLNYASSGTRTVTVTATDPSGASVSKTFTFKVNDVVVFNRAPVANKTLSLWADFNFRMPNYTIPADTFTDPDGDTLTYSATGLPLGLSLSGNVISGTPRLAGVYNATIKATDPKGAYATTTLRINVEYSGGGGGLEPFAVRSLQSVPGDAAVSDAPISAATWRASTTEFAATEIPLSGRFAALDGNISYSIDGLPKGLRIDKTRQAIIGKAADGTAGNHTVVITATDAKGNSVSQTLNLTVRENQGPVTTALPAQQREIGKPVFIQIPKFVDSEGDKVKVTVKGLPAGLRFDSRSSQIIGTPAANAKGDFTIEVKVRDSKGNTAHERFTLSLLDKATLDANAAELAAARLDALQETPITQQDSNAVLSQIRAYNLKSTSYSTMAVPKTDDGRDPIFVEPMPQEPAIAKEYWFSYDQLNRVVIDGGTIVSGQLSISTQGQYLQYNAAGQQSLVIGNKGESATQYNYNAQGLLSQVRAYDSSDVKLLTATNQPIELNELNWRNQASYSYDALNRNIETRNYFALDATTSITVQREISGGDRFENVSVKVDLSGALKSVQTTTYRGDGNVNLVTEDGFSTDRQKVLAETLLNGVDVTDLGDNVTLDARDKITQEELTRLSETSYDGWYDPAGNNTGNVYRKYARAYGESSSTPQSYTWTFSKTTEARDTYMEKTVTGIASNVSSGSFNPASTTSTYDANGNRMAVEERVNGETKVEARHFFHGADGTLLRKYAGTQTSLLSDPTANTRAGTGFALKGAISNYQYSNGNYLGELDSKGNIHFKDQHFSAPGKTDTSSQRYNVRAGDTLQGIAQLFYGSSDYWYIIASANGLSNDSPLQEGTALDIPPRANSENRSDSFKPMDLAQIIGDTTPTLPYAPPPPAAGCNAIATIIIIAIVVVVTVYTAGAATGLTGATTTSAAGTTTAAAGAGTAGAAGTAYGGAYAAGQAALAGSLGVQGAAAAAIGGTVGSLAGQVAGNMLGVQNGYSLKNALASGLTAGITAGAGAALQNAGSVFGQSVMNGDKLNALGRGIQAGTTAAGSVAANKLLGNQASFSWRNVATSAVSAYTGTRLFGDNPALAGVTSGDIVRDTFGGIAHAAVGYGAGKLIQKSGDRPSWNFNDVATDAFGNAVANSIVRGLSKPKTYVEGDTYTNSDGTTSIVGNVDDNGQPTVLIGTMERSKPFAETNHWDIGGELFENRELYLGAVLDAEYDRKQTISSSPTQLSSQAQMNEFWTSIQNSAQNPFTYMGAGALNTLGNVGYGLFDTVSAAWNDPYSASVGFRKSIVNFGPELFNFGVDTVKLSLDGYSLLGETLFDAHGKLGWFRESDPYNIDFLMPYGNSAESGGALLGGLFGGSALAKYGNHSIQLNRGLELYSNPSPFKLVPNDTNGLETVKGVKPQNSPNPEKWVNQKGGSVWNELDGTWVYKDIDGNVVRYPNGYPDFSGGGYVRQSVDIDTVPNHTTDFTNADKLAPLGPKLPENTWHHHQNTFTMEEIDKIIHKRFTHQGGVSIKQNGG